MVGLPIEITMRGLYLRVVVNGTLHYLQLF